MMKLPRLIGLVILFVLLAAIVLSCDSSDENPPDRTPLQTPPDFVGDIIKVQPGNENNVLGTILVEGTDSLHTSNKYVVTVNDQTLILKQDGGSLSETSFEMMASLQKAGIGILIESP
ncbi:MAG: hypothetical protein PHV74_05470 [Dehalococcoidia bacterium]|nr:hypothetical protein [Dehalococcoidia bacterium]